MINLCSHPSPPPPINGFLIRPAPLRARLRFPFREGAGGTGTYTPPATPTIFLAIFGQYMQI